MYFEALPSFQHEYVPQLAADTLLPLWPLGVEAPATCSERLCALKTDRAKIQWNAVDSCLLDLLCYRTPRLRRQCVRATQLCCKELKLSTEIELGLVHLR